MNKHQNEIVANCALFCGKHLSARVAPGGGDWESAFRACAGCQQ